MLGARRAGAVRLATHPVGGTGAGQTTTVAHSPTGVVVRGMTGVVVRGTSGVVVRGTSGVVVRGTSGVVVRAMTGVGGPVAESTRIGSGLTEAPPS